MHPAVIGRIRRRLPPGVMFQRALDVGCGAGLSTGPLDKLVRHSIGLEPAAAMLRWSAATAPNAAFVVGRAEQLPFQDASIDLISAAGSLNYIDLDAFFPEARRVLAPRGALAVYDFSPGRRFRASPDLELWFAEFMRQYPRARDSARALDPDSLASLATGFALQWHEYFEIGLTLTPEFYERYMLTETNVAYAILNGVSEAGIRAWCRRTLEPVFQGAPREVLFEGYIAWLTVKQ